MISIDRPENNPQEKGKWDHIVFADDLNYWILSKKHLDALIPSTLSKDNKILIVGNNTTIILDLISYFRDRRLC